MLDYRTVTSLGNTHRFTVSWFNHSLKIVREFLSRNTGDKRKVEIIFNDERDVFHQNLFRQDCVNIKENSSIKWSYYQNKLACLLTKLSKSLSSPSHRGELQVSTRAADAGYPWSPRLPLRHLSAAGRGGTHHYSLHRLLPVCCFATGKLMHFHMHVFTCFHVPF